MSNRTTLVVGAPSGERLPAFAPALLAPFTPYDVVSFSEVRPRGGPLPPACCLACPTTGADAMRKAGVNSCPAGPLLPHCRSSHNATRQPMACAPQPRAQGSAASSAPTCVRFKSATRRRHQLQGATSRGTTRPACLATRWALTPGQRCSRCEGGCSPLPRGCLGSCLGHAAWAACKCRGQLSRRLLAYHPCSDCNPPPTHPPSHLTAGDHRPPHRPFSQPAQRGGAGGRVQPRLRQLAVRPCLTHPPHPVQVGRWDGRGGGGEGTRAYR